MRALLIALITPALAAPAGSRLSTADAKKLRQAHLARFDEEHKGWGAGKPKKIDLDAIEYSLLKSADLPSKEIARGEQMARDTLTSALALIDPVWGGIYAYSSGGDWKKPRYEKPLAAQADALQAYALATLRFQDASDLKATHDIARFLHAFLRSSEGGFYLNAATEVPGTTSAAYFALGDAERRKRGLPKVDPRLSARENGAAIEALALAASVLPEDAAEEALADAKSSASWLSNGPWMATEALATGRAFLALHVATADRVDLFRAEECARLLLTTRRNARLPMPSVEDDVSLARFANLLYQYSGKLDDRELAESAIRALVASGPKSEQVAAGALLADYELAHDPVHLTIVGKKGDPRARDLFRAAHRVATRYRRIEWWDSSEGPLLNPDVQYPEVDRPAAFACSNHRCSLPVFRPEDVLRSADRLGG